MTGTIIASDRVQSPGETCSSWSWFCHWGLGGNSRHWPIDGYLPLVLATGSHGCPHLGHFEDSTLAENHADRLPICGCRRHRNDLYILFIDKANWGTFWLVGFLGTGTLCLGAYFRSRHGAFSGTRFCEQVVSTFDKVVGGTGRCGLYGRIFKRRDWRCQPHARVYDFHVPHHSGASRGGREVAKKDDSFHGLRFGWIFPLSRGYCRQDAPNQRSYLCFVDGPLPGIV